MRRRCCANARGSRPRHRFARAERLARAAPLRLWAALVLCHRAVHVRGPVVSRRAHAGAARGLTGQVSVRLWRFLEFRLRAPAGPRAGRCRARRSAWAGAPAGRHDDAEVPARRDRREARSTRENTSAEKWPGRRRRRRTGRRRWRPELRRHTPASRRRSSVVTAAWSARAMRTPSAVGGVCAMPSRIELAIPSAQSRLTAMRGRAVIAAAARVRRHWRRVPRSPNVRRAPRRD